MVLGVGGFWGLGVLGFGGFGFWGFSGFRKWFGEFEWDGSLREVLELLVARGCE